MMITLRDFMESLKDIPEEFLDLPIAFFTGSSEDELSFPTGIKVNEYPASCWESSVGYNGRIKIDKWLEIT